MDFLSLDFLVYSSHKTSTQSLLKSLRGNNYKAIHCHTINDLRYLFKLDHHFKKEQYIQYLLNYKIKNNKKIKIISCIRNPKDRLISSFFQSFHTDKINQRNEKENNTIVNLKSEDELITIYEELIKKKSLPGNVESLNEMSTIHNINILELLKKKKDYYYLDHNLFELYVLDFNCIIDKTINLKYLNNILNLDLKVMETRNLSENKSYYNKYKNIKKKIGKNFDSIIENQYNKFYFTAF
uniref:Sulfotransferase domain protein n=1 Tax=Mimiviridae sp. ChoanoV1 TaxID=2596887 RepID=A0A5B8IPG9_9VIRU|nr:sulfotransferase domain protein [Mimiviridae sp. ChoanoV1]